MALLSLPSSRHRWRDAPEPRPSAPQPAAGTALRPSRTAGLSRNKRALVRSIPVLLIIALAALLVAWVSGPSTMTPSEVSLNAHDQVLRDVVRRTGDYSMSVGRLDCVEMSPGNGNCLADLRSKTHQADGLMVAVGYVVDPTNGQLELVVKLP